MNISPTLPEIARRLIDDMPAQAETLLHWFAQRFPEDAMAVQQAETDRAFKAGILVALFERTKPDRPPVSEALATACLTGINGMHFGRIGLVSLPTLLAEAVSGGQIEQHEYESLRWELEDADADPEFEELMLATPPFVLRNKILAMSTDAVLSLVVSTWFWSAQHQIALERAQFIPDPDRQLLADFFRIIPQE